MQLLHVALVHCVDDGNNISFVGEREIVFETIEVLCSEKCGEKGGLVG